MAGTSVDVTARIYHTLDGVAHNEGETYAVTDRATADTLRAIGFVTIDGWTEAPIAGPTIDSLAPASVALGAPDFDIHILGENFAPDSVIVFNGHDEPTTINSDTDVSTGVNMAVWFAPATVPVQVRAGGNLSNAATFTFTETRAGGDDPPPAPRYGRA